MSNPEGFSSDHFYLAVGRSRLQVGLIGLVYLAALTALWLNSIFWLSLQMALTLALVVSMLHVSGGLLSWTRQDVEQMVYRDGKWALYVGDGQWHEASLQGPLHVGYLFVILHFRLEGSMETIVVGRDACEENSYRRLSVLIRHLGPRMLGNG